MKPMITSMQIYGYLFFLLASAIGGAINTFADEADAVAYMDFPAVVEDADVVLVGKLVPISAPCYIVGLNFYRVQVDEVLKGGFDQNSLLVVLTGIDSSETLASLEPEFDYLFFLKNGYSKSEESCGRYTLFSLFRNWRGVVSLNETAAEQRAVDSIEQQSGVSIISSPSPFLDAIRFALIKHDKNSKVELSHLSEEAAAVYSALGF